MADFEITIGLEFHIQLLTNSKLFSSAKNSYNDQPNINIDAVDIALPGALPSVNGKVIEFAIKLGLALNCEFNITSIFSRKHYFYPDLPKGYQITQHDLPICKNGYFSFVSNGDIKTIEIERIHIEEDSGKNIHPDFSNFSYCDYNRAGIPLLEVVTKPNIKSAVEAMDLYRALRILVMHLDICDGNLQEGSMRADVNISIKKHNEDKLGIRTETKNINSIKFLGQAINHEFRRQILEIESGQPIKRETRLWDSHKKTSKSMRNKEIAPDYRFFQDPDLPPLILDSSRIEKIRKHLPESPIQKQIRYQRELELTANQASILISDKLIASYFEESFALHKNAKGIANWIINKMQLSLKIKPAQLAQLVYLIDEKAITEKIAKSIFEKLSNQENIMPLDIVTSDGLKIKENNNKILQEIIENIVSANPVEVAKYRSGKIRVFEFLMGQVIKQTKGVIDPGEAKIFLKKYLD